MSEGVPIYKQNDRQREITRWRSFCAFKAGPVLWDCREVPESASNQLNVSCRDRANLAILGLNLEPMSVCTQAKHRYMDITQQSKYGSGTNARSLANTKSRYAHNAGQYGLRCCDPNDGYRGGNRCSRRSNRNIQPH